MTIHSRLAAGVAGACLLLAGIIAIAPMAEAQAPAQVIQARKDAMKGKS